MKTLIRVHFAIILIAVFMLATGGRALGQGQPPTPEAQPLHILVGKSVIINLQSRLTRVLASNPAVIDTLATTATQVVVEAKSAGTSSLILWDETGHTQMLDVMVDLDLSGLRTAIQEAYPHDNVQVRADNGRIVISGTVKGGQAAQDDLMKMAGIYSKEIVNSLLVPPAPHLRQILMEVTFAEVDRTKLAQQAFNLLSSGAGKTIGATGTQQFGPVSGAGGGSFNITNTLGAAASSFQTSFGLTNLLNIFLFRPDINLGATISDLEQKNLLQILATPNVMAIDGKKASFLAGGEFPFPVVQGGQNIGVVTIQFRPFGVKLDFTGFISDDNVIRLQVAPEVSTLDYSNAVTISGFTVPAISTRRAETEVELRDGQSFGIAGLLDNRVQAQLEKVPGLGDLPILGQLFRSKSFQTSNSELLVLVTPHIVDPVANRTQAPAMPKPAVPFVMKIPKFDQSLPGNKELENQPPVTSPKDKP